MPRSLCQITDLSSAELTTLFALCARIKQGQLTPRPLEGKAAACIFLKESLRTRISFEVGIHQLGGFPIYVTGGEIKLGQRESIADAARVLSRYVSLIVIRSFAQSDVEELARHATVPVINGLTDLVHPCQVLGDYFTLLEHFGPKERFSVAYVGDGNNVTHSWLNLASLIPLDLRIGTVPDYRPQPEFVARAAGNPASKVLITENPKEAVAGADVVYTDVWASMGQKHLADAKAEKLRKFQVNSSLLASAGRKAVVMHCLPAERGREITDEVIDGPQSIVFNQAENRLHIQKALIVLLTQ
ncbi:MAG TPA: ornithine carbamoyltransferase [Candidatus Deferrimicrobium sp.]|nr:ornithine carbamoyltransferase [Candidatus Deferrimicrobium sp.]